MISEKNLTILKNEIDTNFGFINRSVKEPASLVYGIPTSKIDLLMFFVLYALIASGIAGSKAHIVFHRLYYRFPTINNLLGVRAFLGKYKSSVEFWKKYLPENKLRYPTFLPELVEYLYYELHQYTGNNDRDRFINWIQEVDILEIDKYGIYYSATALQKMQKIMGQNVIITNKKVLEYLNSLFGRKFNVHSASHIFKMLATETGCDLWEIDDLITNNTKKRRGYLNER